jgi:uncharacterized protein YraI
MWSSNFIVGTKRGAQRLLCVAVAAFVISAGFFAGSSIAQNNQTYRVVGVAANDVLNVRDGASMRHSIVGIIPPNGRGVTIVGPCAGEWCIVQYDSTRGWVNTSYLAPESPGTAGSGGCRVVGVASNDVLNIRTTPSASSQIVGFIPPDGRNVVVESRGETWWRITYEGTSGWVNSNFLACGS